MPREIYNDTWLDLWCQDKDSILETMIRNMQADLNAGYSPKGNCILKQMQDISDYSASYTKRLDELAEMDPAKCNRWCYMDLKRRGAIA